MADERKEARVDSVKAATDSAQASAPGAAAGGLVGGSTFGAKAGGAQASGAPGSVPRRATRIVGGYEVDDNADYFTSDVKPRPGKAAMVMLLVGVVAFGSFLWLRMRLVTDMPRQAYAEPEVGAVAPPPFVPERAADGSVDLDAPITVNDASSGAPGGTAGGMLGD